MEYQWLDINEYARNFGVSISTIRRRIKKKQLVVQKRSGKYLIKASLMPSVKKDEKSMERQRLQGQIKSLQQEVSELKMLVDIYERKGPLLKESVPLENPS